MQSSHLSVAAVADKRSVFVVTEHLGRTVPVGELSYTNGRYGFVYTCGALHLGARTQVVPLPDLPNLTQRYHSKTLFPVFESTLARRHEGANPDWQLDGEQTLSELAIPTRLPTTQLLVTMPNLRGNYDGMFCCQFYVRETVDATTRDLAAGQLLQANLVQDELGRRARVQLTSAKGQPVDWVPEFLADELAPVWRSGLSLRIELLVDRGQSAPRDERYLIELSGRWPSGYTPMQLLVFSPIVI